MGRNKEINILEDRDWELADYKEQDQIDYIGNPLIEALPKMLNKDEFVQHVTYYPPFDESERQLPAHIKSSCVMRLLQYFQPNAQHARLNQKIGNALRNGYLARNPLLPDFKKRLREIRKHFREDLRKEENELVRLTKSAKATASGFAVIGVSGVGKTTSLNNILELYPQVIVHSEYKKKSFNTYQIVHLSLNCSHAGSLKGICIDFFKEVDRLLGTNYNDKYGSTRNSEDIMLSNMTQIAHIHCLGLLVIDEIQTLGEARRNGADRMLNFFVKLHNTIKVPIIQVGTNKVYTTLTKAFRQARRVTGAMGVDEWKPFDNEEGKGVWDFFLEPLFDCQWTDETAVFDEKFSEVLYDESQGITDIAIKLFMLAQWRAIETGNKKITPLIIRRVAMDSLQLMQPMLKALRSGKIDEISKYSDITPLDIEDYYKKYRIRLEAKEQEDIQRNIKKIQQQKSSQTLSYKDVLITLMEIDVPAKLAALCAKKVYAEQENNDTLESLIKKAYLIASTKGFAAFTDNSSHQAKSKNSKHKKKYISGDLRLIVENAKKSELSGYQVLKDNGIIKAPADEFKIT